MTDFKSVDECEKQVLLENNHIPHSTPKQPLSFSERLFCRVLPSVLLLLSVSLFFSKLFVCHPRYSPDLQSWDYLEPDPEWISTNHTERVALEAHIMSKCPDAQYCLRELVVPAMAKVSDKVDFKLSYIGSIDPNSDDVHCKHGPGECLGNIIELCAAQVYPQPIIYLGFVNCMTAQYQKIPEESLIKDCALEHGVDFKKLNSCISQEGDGMELLRKSVKRSQELGVSTSCTVRLEEHVFCVRDGGEWKDCPGGSSVSDLVASIEDVYNKKNDV